MNHLSPKAKNKLGIASSIPPNMAERFGSAVSPYFQGVQELFPPTNPYGQALSNFLLGQAPQAAQRMAEGYPNVLFDTRNPLGGNRLVNPVALDMAAALPVATALKGAGLLAKGVPLVGGITTFHGSPHKFEPTPLNDLGEFNAAKIGTGEGAQAYGHGHYTAEAQATGEGYKNMLSDANMLVDGAPFKANDMTHQAAVAVYEQKGDKSAAAKALRQEAQDLLLRGKDWATNEANAKLAQADYITTQSKIPEFSENSSGHLYKVDIPDEHIAKMLDWDKPLTATPNGRAALDALMPKLDKDSAKLLKQDAARLDGSGLVTWAQRVYGKDGASAYLQSHGIPGVRYLDAGSRGAEGGTSNFVVFPGNEHMMTILERNGQAMSPESQAIARYREIKGPKSVVRMEAALRTAGVPLPKNEPVAYIQGLVDRAHRRN